MGSGKSIGRRELLRLGGAGLAMSAGCVRYEQPRSRRRGPGTSPVGAGSGEVIFSSPMNGQSEVERFPYTSHSDNISVVPDPAGTGRNVVSISVPEDEFRGADLAYAPEGGELRDGSRTGVNDPDAAYLRYHVYFPEDTKMTDSDGSSEGTKMGGLAGFYTEAGNGGDTGDGHSWSARLQTEGKGDGTFTLYYYVYHMDQEGWGEIEFFDGKYAFGRWHEITLFAQMNDPGKSNGVLRAWMNGNNLVYERDDWRFRSKEHPNAGITRAYGAYVYWGGDWGSPASQNVYFKDMTFRRAGSSQKGGGVS